MKNLGSLEQQQIRTTNNKKPSKTFTSTNKSPPPLIEYNTTNSRNSNTGNVKNPINKNHHILDLSQYRDDGDSIDDNNHNIKKKLDYGSANMKDRVLREQVGDQQLFGRDRKSIYISNKSNENNKNKYPSRLIQQMMQQSEDDDDDDDSENYDNQQIAQDSFDTEYHQKRTYYNSKQHKDQEQWIGNPIRIQDQQQQQQSSINNYTDKMINNKNSMPPPPLITKNNMKKMSTIVQNDQYYQQSFNTSQENQQQQYQPQQIKNTNNNRQIKYKCYKITNNQQLIQHPQKHQRFKQSGMKKNNNNYNTLNLSQEESISYDHHNISNTSAIVPADPYLVDSNNVKVRKYMQENQILKEQLIFVKKELEEVEKEYQKMKMQMSKMEDVMKDKQYELNNRQKSLQKKYKNLQKRQKALQNSKITQSNTYKTLKQPIQSCSSSKSPLLKQICSQKQNINMNNTNIKPLLQQQYNKISQWIRKKILQYKQQLQKNKMSKQVQSIIESFMQQLININYISINSVGTIKVSNNNRSRLSMMIMGNEEEYESTSITPSKCNDNGSRSIIMMRTPHDKTPNNTRKDKDGELRNLQKSLQKLRDMQASYHQGKNNNYNSLDRSSILSYMSRQEDVSRSKSRRKKIFDRTPRANNSHIL